MARPPDLEAEVVHTALVEWVLGEIKDHSSRTYDLGKFIFVASTGTFGGLIATAKDRPFNLLFLVSLAFQVGAVLASLYVAWPKHWKVNGDTRVQQVYSSFYRGSRRGIWTWLTLWIAALALSASYLLSSGYFLHPILISIDAALY